jgi:hypothetical protein
VQGSGPEAGASAQATHLLDTSFEQPVAATIGHLYELSYCIGNTTGGGVFGPSRDVPSCCTKAIGEAPGGR